MIIRNDKTFYDWLFHYNFHRDEWNAFTRQDQNAYWNGAPPKHIILHAPELKDLMHAIQETQGDIELLKKTKIAYR